MTRKDKKIADSGWGIKPDDQPANNDEAPTETPTEYHYEPGDENAVREITRAQRRAFNTANRALVQPGKTTIFDINGDAFVVHGLSFGNETLIELLKVIGAGFDPHQLRALGPEYDGTREYDLTRVWAWGAERDTG